MKKTIILILPLLLFVNFLSAQDEKLLIGKWTNEDKSQIVEVSKIENFYVGTLVDIQAENAHLLLDTENDDETKQNRRLIGAKVWTKFEYLDEKGFWKYGEIYNYKTGNTYNGKIQLDGDELKLTGHYGFFFFLAKTQKWTRISK